MKRSITDKRISSLDIVKILLLFLAFSRVLDVIWRMQEKEIYQAYQSLTYVFVCLALYCIVDLWKSRILMKNKEKYEGKWDALKYRGTGKVILLAANCVVILLLGIARYRCSYGDSMEEIYRRRYLCTENEPVVLYFEEIGDHEMAILEEGEKMVYGLFRRTADSCYRAEDFIFVYELTADNLYEEYEIEISEEQEELWQIISIEGEIQGILTEFYKKNKVFHQADMECVGISYSPMVKNVTVNGSPFCTEQIICRNGRIGYLWRIKLNLEENIRVVYTEN